MNRPVLLSAVLLLALPARSEQARLCSFFPYPFGRYPATATFIGVPRRDTVALPSSDTTCGEFHRAYRACVGGLGGQLVDVEVETLAGARRIEMQQALRGSEARALLVPWGYESTCLPLKWYQSWRWIEAEARGFFIAFPRAEGEWIAGVPTFDILPPHLHPYPSAPGIQRYIEENAGGEPILTVDQYQVFHQALPDQELIETDPDSALARIDNWIEQYPELATRHPASWVLPGARELARGR